VASIWRRAFIPLKRIFGNLGDKCPPPY